MPVLKLAEQKSIPLAHATPSVRVKVHCGCGASFLDTDMGYAHAVETGHTLHVTGEIRVEKR